MSAPTFGGGTDPTSGTSVVEGTLDWVTAESIDGWAWDSAKPDMPIDVDIYDGDKKLATVVADQFREDLVQAKIGNGKHSFSLPTPAGLKDGQPHSIRAKAAGTNTELFSSPRVLKP
jgi:hypothetical protein